MATCLPRLRFTIRSALIGVALLSLNLAGALATANVGGDWPRERIMVGAKRGGDNRILEKRDEYGVGCLYNGCFNMSDGRGSLRLTEVWRPPLPAIRLQVWSPLIASVSITVLVLILSSWSGPAGGVAPDAGAGRRAGRSTARTAARWVLLIVSLIALNVAGAVHRPGFDLYEHDAAHPPSPAHQEGLAGTRSSSWRQTYSSHHRYTLKFVGDFDPARRSSKASVVDDDPTADCFRMEYHDLFVGPPKVLNIEVDGVFIERCQMETGGILPSHEDETRLPDAIFQDSPDGEATIDFRSDGGILAHAGRPGKRLTQPRFIRTPTFSFLEMHGLALASVAITALVLVAVFRRLGPRQRRVLAIALALVGLNAAAAFASYKIGEPPRLLSRLETWGRREQRFPDDYQSGTGPLVGRLEEYFSDGSRTVSTKDHNAPSWRLERAERPSPPPTFLGIWWPAIVDVSITIAILVLGVPRRRGRGPGADALAASDLADRSMTARG